MPNIRINSLPEDGTPSASDVVPIDGATTRKTTLTDLVTAGRPLANQAEAEAGVDAVKAMTPLTTAQAIAAIGAGQFASAAQGATADSALQPDAIGVTVQPNGATLTSLEGLSLASGDILYATAADTLARLPAGTDGQVIRQASGAPSWTDASGLGDLLAANNLDDLDDADTALDNLGFGATGKALAAFATEGEVRGYLSAGTVSANLSAIEALDTSNDIKASDAETGLQYYLKNAADYADEITAANGEGYFIESAGDPTKVWAAPLHTEIVFTELASADPTNTNFSDDALHAAVDISELRGCIPILFPPGHYKFADTYPMGPVPFRGLDQSSAGSGRGVRFSHHSNTDFLIWNGGTTLFAGTGGGFENGWIGKASGFNGGKGISVIAQSNDLRAGEIKFDNIIFTGSSGGYLWETGFFLDGTAANTPGARGVRTCLIKNMRITGCSANNKYAHFKQCTHMHADLSLDTGNGSGTLGITFDDYWENVELVLRSGNCIFNHTGTPGVDVVALKMEGILVTTLDINYVGVKGSFTGDAGSFTNASQNFKIFADRADSFQGRLNASMTNATGDGTSVYANPDTAIRDRNSNFLGGAYKINCAGEHEILSVITLGNVDAAHTSASIGIQHLNSAGTLIDEVQMLVNPAAARTSGNQASFSMTRRLVAAEGDLVRHRALVSGGTKTASIVGGAGTRWTYLAGRLV